MTALLRSKLLVFAAGGLIGAAAGSIGMLVAFPFLFPPAPASEAAPVAMAITATFRFDELAPGRDAVHWADGSGSLLQTGAGWVLRLDGDFRSGPGPNYRIYLSTRPVGEETDFTADAGRVRLAKLRSFEGAQNYLLPPGIDPSKFHTVTIWCESFSQYIGSGALQPRRAALRPSAAPG